MRKFIIKTLLFLLPLLLLGLFTEGLLRNIPNAYSYKSSYLDKHSKDIEILILGNSHAYLGIDPVYFTKNTFNAGNVSQSLDLDFEILNKYKSNLNELRIIVVPMSYFSLWTSLYDSQESWRIQNYVTHYGLKARNLSDYSELLSNTPIINSKRLINFYIKHKTAVDCYELGWGTMYRFSPESQNLEISGKERALGHTHDIHSEANSKRFIQNIKMLELLWDICNQQNIKIIFLTTPTYYTYRENLNTEQLNKMMETINNFIEKRSNCYYFNWLQDPDFAEDDFFDADHLNEIGAEKLSKKLSQQIDLLDGF